MKKKSNYSDKRKKLQPLLVMKIIFTILVLSANLSWASNVGKVSHNDATINEELQQSKIKVSGKVTDQNSQPMYGVTVSIKGTQKATLTDANGAFNVEVANPKS